MMRMTAILTTTTYSAVVASHVVVRCRVVCPPAVAADPPTLDAGIFVLILIVILPARRIIVFVVPGRSRGDVS